MYRGFARELLSILSWIAAAGVGYWIYATKKDMTADIAAQTSMPPQVATVAVALVVALIVLIIVHLVTARISDAILDSQVGMIDRVLGFIFGVLRGFLLFVIPYMAYEAFISPDKDKQAPLVRDAFFRDYVKATGESIRSVLLQVIPQPTRASEPSPADQPGQQGFIDQRGRSVALVIKGQAVLYDGRVTRPASSVSIACGYRDPAYSGNRGGPNAEVPLAHQGGVTTIDGLTFTRYGDDRLREECGVFGIFDHPDAAAITALGLHALQHRGQEAAGICSYDGHNFHSERRMGLVGDNFSKANVLARLKGRMAIGHDRYSTTGDPLIRNVQPLFADIDTGGFAVAHNGNFTNALTLRRELISSGAICQSTSDTEVILHLLSRSKKRRVVERFVDAIRQIEGSYALVCLTNDMMIGARDPVGIRPLVIGRLGTSYVLASETCALDIVGAEFLREVENGEVVVITDQGLESHRPFPMRPARPCIFEYIYFSRPD